MKNLLLLMLCLCLLAQTGMVSAQSDGRPQLEFEALEEGKTITGVFSEDMTSKVYYFSALAGDVISINMNALSDSELDPFLVLLGPRGEVLAVNDNSADGLNAAIEEVALASEGIYFVVATSSIYLTTLVYEAESLATDQEYEISISGITPITDDEASLNFFSGRIEIGYDLDGVINEVEPVYFFTFPAEAGQMVDVRITSRDFDALLYLIDPKGNVIGINDDGEGESNSSDSNLLGIELLEGGLYMVFATNVFYYDPERFDGGEFNISVSESR